MNLFDRSHKKFRKNAENIGDSVTYKTINHLFEMVVTMKGEIDALTDYIKNQNRNRVNLREADLSGAIASKIGVSSNTISFNEKEFEKIIKVRTILAMETKEAIMFAIQSKLDELYQVNGAETRRTICSKSSDNITEF